MLIKFVHEETNINSEHVCMEVCHLNLIFERIQQQYNNIIGGHQFDYKRFSIKNKDT